MRIIFGVLTALVFLACSNEVRVPTSSGLELNNGNCAGCLLNAEEDLFSFVVRTEEDYDSLTANCFSELIRDEWLPPRPGAKKELVYVSLKGAGCKGCLNIVNVRETYKKIVIEVEGGFQGKCEMLIIPGAWALIPRTGKSIVFQFREVICPDE